MHSSLLSRVTALLIGIGGGAGLALAARSHRAWTLSHPGTIMLALAGGLLLACLYVQGRMAPVARGHDERAEAFRLAMLAQYAPERLAAEAATGDELLATAVAQVPLHVS